jgi:hypothetical protein
MDESKHNSQDSTLRRHRQQTNATYVHEPHHTQRGVITPTASTSTIERIRAYRFKLVEVQQQASLLKGQMMSMLRKWANISTETKHADSKYIWYWENFMCETAGVCMFWLLF